jgi:hypothetical protein
MCKVTLVSKYYCLLKLTDKKKFDLLNVLCRVWLATYEKQANAVDTRDEERVRDFIIAKVTLRLPEYRNGIMIFPMEILNNKEREVNPPPLLSYQ